MRIVVAPDKFKGSLTAREVADRIALGLGSDHELVTLPLADGGDGSVDAAIAAGFRAVEVTVPGATGGRHPATIALDESRAVVEVANTCGLALLGDRLDPLGASTRGLGEAIRAAIEHGATTVVVAVGGSASTDGGAGMLAALGIRFLDAAGREFSPSGRSLRDIVTVDPGGLIDLGGITLVCATDVDNPLLGRRGAAAVFAPQKGADAAQVRALEQGLSHLVEALRTAGLVADPAAPGAGAAGGAAFACLALGGTIVPGADFFLDLLDFDTAASAADLVITGEGSLDEQTAGGKLVSAVAARARPARVVAVVGRSLLDEAAGRRLGLDRVYAVADLTTADTSRDADLTAELLERIGREIAAVPRS